MENFNKLTPSQTERLAMLSEECGELIQVIGKILRHGYESFHPDFPEISNRDLLRLEIIDVCAIMDKMEDIGDIKYFNYMNIDQAWNKKLRYAYHQGKENNE